MSIASFNGSVTFDNAKKSTIDVVLYACSCLKYEIYYD